jgi:hypothetical protein
MFSFKHVSFPLTVSSATRPFSTRHITVKIRGHQNLLSSSKSPTTTPKPFSEPHWMLSRDFSMQRLFSNPEVLLGAINKFLSGKTYNYITVSINVRCPECVHTWHSAVNADTARRNGEMSVEEENALMAARGILRCDFWDELRELRKERERRTWAWEWPHILLGKWS